MSVEIQFEEIFFEKLNYGINLFTGAGFSVLPSPDGKCLPISAELARDICYNFNLPSTLAENLDLEMVSTMARQKDSYGFDKFLREAYRVLDSNPLYDVINKININSYITTNIDNLFQTIIEKDGETYINSLINGKAKKIGRAINYIPLHGDITDPDSFLYFGTFEISKALAENHKLFAAMETEIYRYPTLFWGYGFHDSSVLNSLGKIMTENKKNIWIQFRKNNKNLELYKSLGFNIIIADTDELLETISKKYTSRFVTSKLASESTSRKVWKPYEVPSQNQLKLNISASEYFREGKIAWNIIFSKYPYETIYLREIHEKFLKNKNLIVVGTPQCGKTTLLRQLVVNIEEQCYYITEITVNQAEKLVKSLDEKIVVFVDECTADIEAFVILANNPKIHLIGVTDEYGYESSKHLLETEYEVYIIPDLDKSEANFAYEHIPPSIKNEKFSYSRNINEKYSFLEFSFENIRDVISKDKVKKFLKTIDDTQIREILFLTAHLSRNGSFLSVDVLWSYIGAKNFNDIKQIINKANEALTSIDEKFYPDLHDQDYYVLRSNIFLNYLIEVALDDYLDEYGNVVRKLINKVPRGHITRYYIYKRRAYDASLFYRLFGSNAADLYDIIYSFDDSPYTLQQKALYLSKVHRFTEAFELIDRASQELHNNFSIRNTKAVITFEANRYSEDPQAKSQLDKAMSTLAICYKSDRRKIYHAQKFAEYAIFINERYKDSQYLNTAEEWLKAAIDNGVLSERTKKLMYKIEGQKYKEEES